MTDIHTAAKSRISKLDPVALYKANPAVQAYVGDALKEFEASKNLGGVAGFEALRSSTFKLCGVFTGCTEKTTQSPIVLERSPERFVGTFPKNGQYDDPAETTGIFEHIGMDKKAYQALLAEKVSGAVDEIAGEIRQTNDFSQRKALFRDMWDVAVVGETFATDAKQLNPRGKMAGVMSTVIFEGGLIDLERSKEQPNYNAAGAILDLAAQAFYKSSSLKLSQAEGGNKFTHNRDRLNAMSAEMLKERGYDPDVITAYRADIAQEEFVRQVKESKEKDKTPQDFADRSSRLAHLEIYKFDQNSRDELKGMGLDFAHLREIRKFAPQDSDVQLLGSDPKPPQNVFQRALGFMQ